MDIKRELYKHQRNMALACTKQIRMSMRDGHLRGDGKSAIKEAQRMMFFYRKDRYSVSSARC